MLGGDVDMAMTILTKTERFFTLHQVSLQSALDIGDLSQLQSKYMISKVKFKTHNLIANCLNKRL